jgi:mannose-1-phosphate guanylyltransferase
MDVRAVIIAGGIGTRFWPLSRKKNPKQFLPIISAQTMIEETVNRLLPFVSPSHIYTIANRAQTQIIQRLLPSIPDDNLLVEPMGKNTAPSLLLATAAAYLENPEAAVVALPADHLITDTDRFLKKLEAGAQAVLDGDHLVTLGIPPSYPATGYGYIQFSRSDSVDISQETFYLVERFKEKPRFEQAKDFIDEGNNFWNSGMFIWQAQVFPKKLEEYASDLYPFWEKTIEALKSGNESMLLAVFEEIPSISIDYALMEKAHPVWMCVGDFGWSDVGAWSSLTDIWTKDSQGNTLRGENIVIDSENCLLYSPDKLTALVGVRDLIVVETEDALLICRKDVDQKVKDIVQTLKKKGKKEYL